MSTSVLRWGEGSSIPQCPQQYVPPSLNPLALHIKFIVYSSLHFFHLCQCLFDLDGLLGVACLRPSFLRILSPWSPWLSDSIAPHVFIYWSVWARKNQETSQWILGYQIYSLSPKCNSSITTHWPMIRAHDSCLVETFFLACCSLSTRSPRD